MPDSAGPQPSPGLLDGYSVPPGVFDEMYSGPERLRGHWEYLLSALGSLGGEEIERRGLEASRILRENGVTYNVYSDPRGDQRPWAFDPIPVLFTSREWGKIETGMNQRAELFDLLLTDLYGSRTTIRRGLLPPELIFAHPGFLRCCQGMYERPGRRLLMFAADLGRAPDGAIWVVGDRAQAPSGVGYAPENRIVLSRVMPSLYRDSQVHRLATFFRSVRSTLGSLAPQENDSPRIVLMTPGPGNETFFEHAYLANYLGFPLVQGGDLTVRDRRVWLKTLDGLQPVHVILRRVDDSYCDPLELRSDSLLGTPGLVEAARSGHVVIANPLGSGILENPGLLAFMPQLVKELLGEEMVLPNVATWWCGRPAALSHVLSNLDRLVVKQIHRSPGFATVFAAQLSRGERDALADRIRARPHLYVGQEPIPLSTTPTLRESRLEPRPMVLRCFLVARGESYAVMPGGLIRVAPSSDELDVSSQHGGVSKDAWVLASEPESQITLLHPDEHPVALSRGGGEISSRLADNLFWLGRYAERTDATARLLRQLLVRLLDGESDRSDASIQVLSCALEDHMDGVWTTAKRVAATAPIVGEQELLDLILNPDRPGSLRFNVNALAGAARSARDRLSDDTWRVITSLVDELDEPTSLSEVLDRVEGMIIILSAFAGLCAESMSRTQGWRFLDMGRRLERALFTVHLLNTYCVPVYEPPGRLWEVLLSVTDSVMTYRRRYRSHFQAGAVLDLLLHDEGNPRSVGFQLVRLQDQVGALPGKQQSLRRSSEERVLLEAVTALRLTDMDSLVECDAGERHRPALAQLLQRIDSLLQALSEAIGRAYFDHVETPQQLVEFT